MIRLSTRLRCFRRNAGWLYIAQTVVFAAVGLILAGVEVAHGRFTDTAVWSPVLFFVTAPLVTTITILSRLEALRLLLNLARVVTIGALALGLLLHGNIGAFWDIALPAAWFTLGLTFWIMSHPLIGTTSALARRRFSENDD